MTLEGFDNDDRGPNGPIGINANGGDGPHANLGWFDKLVDEDSCDTQEDNNDSQERVGGENEECGLGLVDANEGGSYENLDSLGKTTGFSSAVKNEDESKGLSSEEDIDYLDSSNVGSYQIDSDGDFISKKTAKMMTLGREELNVELNKQCVMRAKKWTMEKIRGSVVHEFGLLFNYVYELRIVDLEVGKDNNNQIFPIAWAVVEVKNNETWAWFLNHLQSDLNLGNGEKLTLLSDKQKAS
ncbi:hypothetical protein V6N12_037968 [Hibiscus sabdariffa]|uniref:MULE transposase domain-containing protein n=1 Tax=Hibiscus sabdariffa TaxID=183260 RepID=A0ABR2BDW4_9ROSI